MKNFIRTLLLIITFSACKSIPTSTNASSNTLSSKSTPNANKVLGTAKQYLGTKYRIGGTDHNGIDCSGLALKSYESINVKLPRTAHEQAKIGKRKFIGELQVGDLVFFTDKKVSTKITHVGIISYVDAQKVSFIHASTSHGVREDELLTGYWRDHYVSARRIL